jgi:hypothetical protein
MPWYYAILERECASQQQQEENNLSLPFYCYVNWKRKIETTAIAAIWCGFLEALHTRPSRGAFRY